MKRAGVVENMSYYEHKWARNGSSARAVGQRVSEQLTAALGHDVPLMAHRPLMPELRETGEEGRLCGADAGGRAANTPLADEFSVSLAR